MKSKHTLNKGRIIATSLSNDDIAVLAEWVFFLFISAK